MAETDKAGARDAMPAIDAREAAFQAFVKLHYGALNHSDGDLAAEFWAADADHRTAELRKLLGECERELNSVIEVMERDGWNVSVLPSRKRSHTEAEALLSRIREEIGNGKP